jgi:hypothetical protein
LQWRRCRISRHRVGFRNSECQTESQPAYLRGRDDGDVQPARLRFNDVDQVGTPGGTIFPNLEYHGESRAGIGGRRVRSAALPRDCVPGDVDRIGSQTTRKSKRIRSTPNATRRRSRCGSRTGDHTIRRLTAEAGWARTRRARGWCSECIAHTRRRCVGGVAWRARCSRWRDERERARLCAGTGGGGER